MQAQQIDNRYTLDVKNLSSRKLFELLSVNESQPLSRQQQLCVEQELVDRQHYLQELGRLRGLL